MSLRIKFGSVREDDIPHQDLPAALLDDHDIAAGSLFFLLDRSAWRKIQAHAARFASEANRGEALECAGLLAGHASYDQSRQVTLITVREAVETRAASQSPGSVRIAPQDFHHARQQIDRQGMRVVGWYHTHPDYGIFLSSDDKLVIQSLFNASYHVALVYDPIRKQVGCFSGPQFQRVDDSDQVTDRKRNFQIVDDWSLFDPPSADEGERQSVMRHEEQPTLPPTDYVPPPLPPANTDDLTVDPNGPVPSQGIGAGFDPSISGSRNRHGQQRPPTRPHRRGSSRAWLPLLLSGGVLLLLVGLGGGVLLAGTSFFRLAALMLGRH